MTPTMKISYYLLRTLKVCAAESGVKMSKMNTMTKVKKLPFGTNVRVVISLKVDNFNLNDQKEVWKYFGECSDTFSLCRIPCVVGEVKRQ